MSTVTVGSTAALTSALNTAQAGDTVLLQAGTYDGFYLANKNFGAGVTITSADPTHQAVMTDFNLQDVSGIAFTHLDMKVLLPNYNAYNIYGGQHITFDQVHVYGPAGAPDPDVQAVNFFDSAYVTFTNSEIEQVSHGLSIARSDHIVVSGNNIHNVNSDTLDFVQVSNAVISGNMLHDFFPTAGNHPDAMQFGTMNSVTPSHDVTISDNLIYRGAGQNAQGIWISDDLGTMPFQNFTITNNTVIGTGASALRPIHLMGGAISGNDLVTLAGGDVTNLLVQYSDSVALANNIASAISLTAANGNTNFTETNDTGNAAAVTDGGAALIQQWLSTHIVGPQGQAAVSPPPPPPPPAPAPAIAPVINHAPSGTDATQALAWNATKVFASADFGFSDPDSNHFLAVKLDTLPSLGTLTDNGVAVTPGQVIGVADITGGKLVYHAPAISTAAHVDLTFQVQDDGGTANGGVNLDQTANDLHFDVAAPPPPPPPTGTGTQTTSTSGQNLVTTSTNTKITGGAGDDTLSGGSTADYLHGADGNDVINGGSAFDDINGMVGNDTAHGNGGDDWVVGGKGADMLFGDAGNDIVWGNVGNDTLDGGDGADQVRGGQGDDNISGGAGNDFISGDLGNDTETGGAGADTFHGSQNIGIDRVLDFSQADGDHVLLDSGTTYTVSQVGADTVIDMGAGSEMILVGVQLSTLHTGWIGVG